MGGASKRGPSAGSRNDPDMEDPMSLIDVVPEPLAARRCDRADLLLPVLGDGLHVPLADGSTPAT